MSANPNRVVAAQLLAKYRPDERAPDGAPPTDAELAHACLTTADELMKSPGKFDTATQTIFVKMLLEVGQNLIKTARLRVDDAGHVDLASGASRSEFATRAWKTTGQRLQRNIAPATQTAAQVFKASEGDLGRCARYCKSAKGTDVQGRACPVCKGAGYSVGKRIRDAQRERTSIHAPNDKQSD